MVRLRSSLVIALLAAGAASADSTFVSGTAEPSSTPPLTINNPESPTGTVGVAYPPFQFTASNGAAPLTWSETPRLTMGLSLTPAGVLSGTPTSDGHFLITLKVTDALNHVAYAHTTVRVSLARPPASFTQITGTMTVPRSGHTATLLLNGKVLVTGGGNGAADASAEVYDPETQSFTPTGIMTEGRIGHRATLLGNSALANYGKVLILGSTDNTAELYDPGSGTFTATGHMNQARTSPTATLLKTGQVLVVGGNPSVADLRAELYDPVSGTFSYTSSTTMLRTGHTATLLDGGQVLVAGGGTATAELYDPTHRSFTAIAGAMTEAFSGHTATILEAAEDMQYGQKGYVLILGTDGYADLYHPSTGMFEGVGSLRALFDVPPTSTHPFISNSTASLRDDGTVVAAGGYFPVFAFCRGVRATGNSSNGAGLFAPESDGFTGTGSLHTSRDTHTATVLRDGTVLVTGGTHRVYNPGHCFVFCTPCRVSNTVLSTAELFK